jgi:haloalkane dehalogenase
MDVLRTPDERFANLPDYPFAPHYIETDGVRIHYVDEGPRDAAPVLLLHGEPSWSFLYRTMIPIISVAGYRVIAPDLVGFGRSDKPVNREDYTYARHVAWMWSVIATLDLRDITLFCQDWGGLIGLRIVAEHGDRFARVIAANTGLPTGDQPMSRAFLAWQALSQRSDTMDIGAVVQIGCQLPLSPEIIAAYNAPFPDESYKAGARRFPLLMPTAPDDPAAPANRAAWQVLAQWTKPFLTAFSDGDPITRGADRLFQTQIPGAQGQPHVTISGAGHFVQEDQGPQLALIVIDFIRSG